MQVEGFEVSVEGIRQMFGDLFRWPEQKLLLGEALELLGNFQNLQ